MATYKEMKGEKKRRRKRGKRTRLKTRREKIRDWGVFGDTNTGEFTVQPSKGTPNRQVGGIKRKKGLVWGDRTSREKGTMGGVG